ncbi:MAG: hypothetical protein COB36_15010 [Alphaproteobacteria bacterium]|nr:MAG: hypothetical protein COB36_15010 [Alphaproteobacteria bacterium]
MKFILKWLIVFSCVNFTGSVSAQEQNLEKPPHVWLDKDGKALPETPWQKSNGSLGVMQMLTTEPEEFLANWDKVTKGVHIELAEQVSKGTPIVSFLLFTGCKPDDKNNCRLGLAYKVVAPSGKLYHATDMMEAWVDKPAPPKQSLQLSVNYLGTIIEPKDELGEYIIYCMVYDLNAGTEILTKQTFLAVD